MFLSIKPDCDPSLNKFFILSQMIHFNFSYCQNFPGFSTSKHKNSRDIRESILSLDFGLYLGLVLPSFELWCHICLHYFIAFFE